MKKTTLEIAQALIDFAKTLSDDHELLSASLGIAQHSIVSDSSASRRENRPSR